jgi:drug/metabolite transporter (DMT)-like permease
MTAATLAAEKQPIPVLSLIALALLIVVWGLSIPVTKLGLADFPPLTLTALRYLSAAPFFVWLAWRAPRPPARALAAMAGIGVVGIGVGQVTQAVGVNLTAASVATVIGATIPILVVLLAAIRLGQRIRPVHIVGLLVAIGGVGVIATGGKLSALTGAGGALLGDGLMLVSAASVALYYILSTELAARYGVLTVAAWGSLFGTAALIPFAGWELAAVELRTPTAIGIASVLYLGLFVTVAGVLVWLSLMRSLPARIAAGSQYMQPLVGIVASAWLFGDAIGPTFLTGAALVLAGIALTAWTPRHAA